MIFCNKHYVQESIISTAYIDKRKASSCSFNHTYWMKNNYNFLNAIFMMHWRFFNGYPSHCGKYEPGATSTAHCISFFFFSLHFVVCAAQCIFASLHSYSFLLPRCFKNYIIFIMYFMCSLVCFMGRFIRVPLGHLWIVFHLQQESHIFTPKLLSSLTESAPLSGGIGQRDSKKEYICVFLIYLYVHPDCWISILMTDFKNTEFLLLEWTDGDLSSYSLLFKKLQNYFYSFKFKC